MGSLKQEQPGQGQAPAAYRADGQGSSGAAGLAPRGPTPPHRLPARPPARPPAPTWCVRPVSGRQLTRLRPPPASAAASAASEQGAGLPSAASAAPGAAASTEKSVRAGLPPCTTRRATLRARGRQACGRVRRCQPAAAPRSPDSPAQRVPPSSFCYRNHQITTLNSPPPPPPPPPPRPPPPPPPPPPPQLTRRSRLCRWVHPQRRPPAGAPPPPEPDTPCARSWPCRGSVSRRRHAGGGRASVGVMLGAAARVCAWQGGMPAGCAGVQRRVQGAGAVQEPTPELRVHPVHNVPLLGKQHHACGTHTACTAHTAYTAYTASGPEAAQSGGLLSSRGRRATWQLWWQPGWRAKTTRRGCREPQLHRPPPTPPVVFMSRRWSVSGSNPRVPAHKGPPPPTHRGKV